MGISILDKGFEYAESIDKYLVVKVNSDGKVAKAGNGEGGIGVAIESGDTGDFKTIRLSGIADVRAGDVITAGDRLTTNDSGEVIKAAPASGENVGILGIALQSAGESGEVIQVLLSQHTLQG